MAIELNHTIVHVRDKHESATFLAEVLGLPKPQALGPFLAVQTSNNVSLDFRTTEGKIAIQHYAFLVSEAEFDDIFDRIKARELTYWADPMAKRPGEINHDDGGRGVYFCDPSGHYLEVLTRPYGGG